MADSPVKQKFYDYYHSKSVIPQSTFDSITLEPGWQKSYTKDKTQIFFINPEGKRVWSAPVAPAAVAPAAAITYDYYHSKSVIPQSTFNDITLEPGWQKRYTKDNTQIFFINPKGEKVWTAPKATSVPIASEVSLVYTDLPKGWAKYTNNSSNKEYYSYQKSNGTYHSQYKKPKSDGIDYVDGWTQYLNDDSGEPYYEKGGQTQWEEPLEVAPATEKPLVVATPVAAPVAAPAAKLLGSGVAAPAAKPLSVSAAPAAQLLGYGAALPATVAAPAAKPPTGSTTATAVQLLGYGAAKPLSVSAAPAAQPVIDASIVASITALPKVNNVNDIDEIIKKIHGIMKGKEITGPETTIQSNRDLAIDNYIFLSDLQKGAIRGWSTLSTVGDGTCFIHAALQAISPLYRRLPLPMQTEIGQLFRKNIFVKEYAVAKDQRFIKSDAFLTDMDVYTFATHYHINIVVLGSDKTSGYERGHITLFPPQFIPENPVIFIYNAYPYHYETIMTGAAAPLIISHADFISQYGHTIYADAIKTTIIHEAQERFIQILIEKLIDYNIYYDGAEIPFRNAFDETFSKGVVQKNIPELLISRFIAYVDTELEKFSLTDKPLTDEQKEEIREIGRQIFENLQQRLVVAALPKSKGGLRRRTRRRRS